MFSPQIFITEDSSHSLKHQLLDETYHSMHGAIQESVHTFIDAGLRQSENSPLRVLEIGFGTGLNAFLTFLEAEIKQLQIAYTAVELYPISMEVAESLNYADMLAKDKKDVFYHLHSAPWQEKISISSNFELYKLKADFVDLQLSDHFDVVYFDAFSPEKQAAMWTADRFQMIYDACNPHAVLTTYCAKGAVRRAMQSVGFTVERIEGAKGKREMLRARKLPSLNL